MSATGLGGPVAGLPKPAFAVAGDPTILVVDDEPLVLEVMAEALREHGLYVVACADADEGLDALGRIGGPTVLVADVGLRGRSGPALAEAFRAVRPNGAVVFVTGLASDRFVRGLGERDVLLQKPFGGRDLCAAVSRAAALPAGGMASAASPGTSAMRPREKRRAIA
jgi:DNA-binding response OmpR family regulator